MIVARVALPEVPIFGPASLDISFRCFLFVQWMVMCLFWLNGSDERISEQTGSRFLLRVPVLHFDPDGSVYRSSFTSTSSVFCQAMGSYGFFFFYYLLYCCLTLTKTFCFHPQSTLLKFSLLEHRVSSFLRNVGINRLYAYKTCRNLKYIYH